MRYEPGIAHTLSGKLVNRSDEPIIDGTVDLYLYCTESHTGEGESRVGKWYVNNNTWATTETAYASDHADHAASDTQGVWTDEVRSEAFASGRKYRATWKDSAGRGREYTEEIDVADRAPDNASKLYIQDIQSGLYAVTSKEHDKTGFALTSAYDAAKTAATQTSVDAILEDTGTTLPAAIAGVTATVDEEAIAQAVVTAIGETGVTVDEEALQESINDALRGEGSTTTTLTIKDSGNTPIGNVDVWVTTDSAGANVVAGTRQTNASGQVVFDLDAGTYYRWAQKSGVNFTNPSSFTVT